MYEKGELKLVESDSKVLIFLDEQIRQTGLVTIESTGLAEIAVEKGIVNTASSFSTCIARLKRYQLIEAVRAGWASLYIFTRQGRQELEHILHSTNENVDKGESEPMALQTGTSITKGIMEDKLREGIAAGKLPDIFAGGADLRAPALEGVALPKEGLYSRDVAGLQKLYRERVNSKADQNELSRIAEWFQKLAAGGQPAFDWVQTAICITSTKVRVEQRNIAYIIGILKTWSKYGFGTDYNAEQKKMFEKFEDRFGYTLSTEARNRFLALVDTHGIVDTLEALFLTEAAVVDMSKLIVEQMELRLTGKGGGDAE